jgi:hypothetical protein
VTKATAPAPGWGAAHGFIALDTTPTNRFAGSDLATYLINERISRYGWAFDERRADLLAECFTEDAEWSGNIGGVDVVDPVRGRSEIVAWLSEFWPRQLDQRRHHMMSVSLSVSSPESATAISSLLLTSATHGSLSLVLTSFYTFELVCSNGVWRIKRLFEGCDVPF